MGRADQKANVAMTVIEAEVSKCRGGRGRGYGCCSAILLDPGSDLILIDRSDLFAHLTVATVKSPARSWPRGR